MFATALWHHPLMPLQWGVVMVAALVGAGTDIKSRRIPNWLTGPVLLSGLVFAGVTAGWAGLGDALAGMLLAGVPFVVLFMVGGGGAGDAKLMAALGAWLGVINSLVLLTTVTVLGAVIGLGYALARGQARGVFHNLWAMVLGMWVGAMGRKNPRDLMPGTPQMVRMPYGLSILAGACAAAGGVYLWRC